MRNNAELQKNVQDAITWEPLLKAAEIGVTAKDGVITLTGTVDSYAKKAEAEDAAKSVEGVTAVIEKIELKFDSERNKKDDSDIANEAVRAFSWNWKIPREKVKIRVENGMVTLEGEVSWHYQKEAAQDAVKNLLGVKGVWNNITIKSETQDRIEKKGIESALERNWAIDDKDINVGVSGHNVTLSGTVGSVYQKDEAAEIAWAAPGIYEVNNELVVDYSS